MNRLRAFLVPVVAGVMLGASALAAQVADAVATPGYDLRSGLQLESQPEIRIVEAIDDSRLVTLRGNTHPLAKKAFDRGRVSPELVLGDLVLVLRRSPQQQAAFDSFVASQYDRSSANYHKWLTPAQVGAFFGPAQSDVDAVSNWLSGHGFAIEEVTENRLSIRFSGTTAQVESAFHTEMHSLEVKGERHIGNIADPRIPAAMATVVVGVKALHNFFPKPLHRVGGQVSLDRESGQWRRLTEPDAAPKSAVPPTRVRPQFGTVDGYGNAIQDVTPYDFAKIYNVLPEWQAASPIDGTGQTVAIAGTSNINLADVAAFRSAFGLPAKAPTVLITNNDPGACPSFADSCSGDLIENTLDVEWSGAVAKGASIVLVTSSAPTPTSDSLYLSESYIVAHKTASIMNVSYGECEVALGNAGNAEYNNLWQTAAAEGIAVFVASGDAGSPACDQGFDAFDGVPYAAQFGLAVSGITSTPYNTSVGGTDFNWQSAAANYWSTSNSTTTKADALGYIPEVPWNSTCVNPLVLPGLQSDASYIGVNGVVDAESACNFAIESGSYVETNFGVDLFSLVDTIGGGGGVSNCTNSNNADPETCSGGYAKPSWQAGVKGIPADNLRDVPDLSFFASNGFLGSAYLICVSGGGNACTYSATTEPTAQEVGGTSVASPAMAGVMALINQKSGSAQGNPNTNLYSLAARENYSSCSAETVLASSSCIFNDIDTGTNAMPCQSGTLNCNTIYNGDPAGTLTGYSAGAGFDLATGLGSLNVANVVNNWPGVVASPTLSPTALTFAPTTIGTASATQAITLKNAGKTALTLNGTGQGISIAGANASSFSETNTCGTSLAAGASCTITVTFKPTTAGTLTAAVNVADNAYGSPQTVSLNGTGATGAPAVQISADSIAFGSTAVGSTNTAPAITLSNTGSAALSLTSIALTGTNASSFAQTNTCGTSVAAGASCSITISFKPTSAGSLTAALTVTDNAANSPQSVGLSGTATGSTLAISVTPASLTFAATAVGSTTAAQVATVKNTGTSALTISQISVVGTYASSFVKSATSCGTSLAVGASCTVSIQFKPATTGTLTGSLTIADNVSGSPQTVALQGTGGTSAPAITLSPTTLTFASTAVGSTTAAQTVTVNNTGTASATLSSETVTGTNATSFLKTATTCGATLAAGASCTVSVDFKPSAAGALTASLAVADNATGSPQTVALKGTGTAATTITVTVSPATLTFAATTVGSTASPQTVTLKNTGTATATLTSKTITGTNASSFVLAAVGCGGSLASGASCTISVAFKPTATGTLTGALSIADNATGSPQTVTLTGTGK